MGVTVVWDTEEQTALRFDFVGQWQWNEYDAAVRDAYAFLQQVSHRVDIIANLRSGPHLAVGYVFAHFRATLQPFGGRVGFIAIVNGAPMTRTIIKSFLRVFSMMGQKTFFVDSLDEARRILASRRAQGSSPAASTPS